VFLGLAPAPNVVRSYLEARSAAPACRSRCGRQQFWRREPRRRVCTEASVCLRPRRPQAGSIRETGDEGDAARPRWLGRRRRRLRPWGGPAASGGNVPGAGCAVAGRLSAPCRAGGRATAASGGAISRGGRAGGAAAGSGLAVRLTAGRATGRSIACTRTRRTTDPAMHETGVWGVLDRPQAMHGQDGRAARSRFANVLPCGTGFPACCAQPRKAVPPRDTYLTSLRWDCTEARGSWPAGAAAVFCPSSVLRKHVRRCGRRRLAESLPPEGGGCWLLGKPEV